MIAKLAAIAALAGSAIGATVVLADDRAPAPAKVPAVKRRPQGRADPAADRGARRQARRSRCPTPTAAPAWALRTFDDAAGNDCECFEVGRLQGERFGWIDAHGTFTPAEPGQSGGNVLHRQAAQAGRRDHPALLHGHLLRDRLARALPDDQPGRSRPRGEDRHPAGRARDRRHQAVPAGRQGRAARDLAADGDRARRRHSHAHQRVRRLPRRRSRSPERASSPPAHPTPPAACRGALIASGASRAAPASAPRAARRHPHRPPRRPPRHLHRRPARRPRQLHPQAAHTRVPDAAGHARSAARRGRPAGSDRTPHRQRPDRLLRHRAPRRDQRDDHHAARHPHARAHRRSTRSSPSTTACSPAARRPPPPISRTAGRSRARCT